MNTVIQNNLTVDLDVLLPLLRQVKLRQKNLPDILSNLGLNYSQFQKIRETNKKLLKKENLYNLRHSFQTQKIRSISEKEFCHIFLRIENAEMSLDDGLNKLGLTLASFELLKRKYQANPKSLIFRDSKGDSFRLIAEMLSSVGPIPNTVIQQLLLKEGIDITRQRISELVIEWESRICTKCRYPSDLSVDKKKYWQQKYKDFSGVKTFFSYSTILFKIKSFLQLNPDAKAPSIQSLLREQGITLPLPKVKSLIRML
jgi:hypothetical protein